MAKHIDLGKKGEKLAADFLINIGYKIIDLNWRLDKDEIDIIAKDGDELVIVEVKTRSTNYFGYPEESVDYRKEKFLIRATETYLEEKKIDSETRFDIIAIIIDDKATTIDHIKDAFYPE